MRKIGVVVVVYNLFPCLVQDPSLWPPKDLKSNLLRRNPPKGPGADSTPLCPAGQFCCSCVGGAALF